MTEALHISIEELADRSDRITRMKHEIKAALALIRPSLYGIAQKVKIAAEQDHIRSGYLHRFKDRDFALMRVPEDTPDFPIQKDMIVWVARCEQENIIAGFYYSLEGDQSRWSLLIAEDISMDRARRVHEALQVFLDAVIDLYPSVDQYLKTVG